MESTTYGTTSRRARSPRRGAVLGVPEGRGKVGLLPREGLVKDPRMDDTDDVDNKKKNRNRPQAWLFHPKASPRPSKISSETENNVQRKYICAGCDCSKNQ